MPTFFSNDSAIRNVSISKCSANRKRQLKIFGLLTLIVGSLFSCVTTKNIEFQALKPARVNIGDDFNNIYIYCKHIRQNDLSVSSSRDIIPFSSVKFSRTVKSNLEKTPQLYRTKIRILDHDSLLVFRSKAPGILIIADSINFAQVKKAYRNDWMYGAAYNLGYSIFSRSRSVLIKKSLKSDTIWFQNTYLENGLSVFDKLQACVTACEMAAEECANFLVPHWQDKSRKFYFQAGSLSKAFKLIQRNNLDSALSVLEDYYHRKTNNAESRMKALYNMAVIYELKDDFEKAYSLADSSLKIMNNEQSKNYCQILYARKLDKEVLDWQLK